MCTQPGVGGTEKTFNRREMSKEELLSLTLEWLEQTMDETSKQAMNISFRRS
jgi:hypothetical protein